MTAAIAPDRAERPGGRWSTPHLVEDLLRLATFERAVAHLVAGWVPKVPELDEKLQLAAQLESTMGRALALRQHALTLLERDESAVTASAAWIEPLRAIDTSRDAHHVVHAILGDVTSFLLARYRDLALRIDPLYDARLAATVRSAIDALSAVPAAGGAGDASFVAAMHAAWSDHDSPIVPIDRVLWGPHDRVLVPARPAGRPRPTAGARGHFRSCSRLEDEDIAGELNDNVMAELCAMELLCRCSYEHPDRPWSFHMALARHATDEQRHAAIFRRLLATGGFSETNLPQHGANYEYAYEFPECEIGSPRELAWRLLIMCTVLEALAVDKLPVEIATRDWLDQTEFARALDYIATDELFHTENGLRLTRALCEELHLHPVLERERVHGRFFGSQRDERMRYLEADPDRAAWEIAILDGPDPDGAAFTSRTEVELRRRALFTDAECEQVDRWGYNPRGSEGMLASAGS